MKKILAASALASMLAATQASAAIYNITFSYQEMSGYTASKPLDPSGELDPGDAINLTDTGGDPALGIASTPVYGVGTLDTDTGEIYLGPIDYEVMVRQGSIGYVGWSQTLNGSFSGTSFTMTSATVNGGALICEDETSNSCLSGGTTMPGDAPGALENPQSVQVTPPPNPFVPGTTTVTPLTIEFTSLGTGGMAIGGAGFADASNPDNYLDDGLANGQGYYWQGTSAPGIERLINIEIGSEVSAVPVPAAAWLFGSGLLGLASVARKRRA